MELVSLRAQNFRSHTDTLINFKDFNVAIVLGRRNKNFGRSNGAGKSTIFKAIKWILFDELDDDDEQIVKWSESKCLGKLKFIEDGALYLVKRILSVNGDRQSSKLVLKVKQRGIWEDISDKGIRAKLNTQKKIYDIIRCDGEIFNNTCYISQGEIGSLMKLRPAERREVFSRPEGLLVYQEGFKFSRKTLSTLKTDLRFAQEKITDFKDNYKSQFSEIESPKALHLKLSEKEKDLESVKDKIEEYEDGKRKSSESDSAKKQIAILQKAIDDAETQVEDLEEQNSKILKEGKDADDEIEEIDKRLRKVDKDVILAEKFQKENAISNISDDIKEMKSKIKEKQALYENLQRTCSQCGNELDDDQYRDRKRTLKEEMKTFSNDLEDLYTQKESLSERFDKAEEKLDAVADLSSKRVNLQKILGKYNTVWASVEQARTVLNKIKEENETKILQLKRKVVEDDSDESEYKELKENYDKVSGRISVLKDRLKNSEKVDEDRKKQISKFKNLIRDKFEKRHEFRVQQYVSLMFSRDGIQSDVVREAVPELEQYTNEMLQYFEGNDLQIKIITEDKNGNDIFDFEVMSDGQKLPYATLSGGEKLRVAFAFRVGSALRLSHIRGCKLDFLLVDETEGLDEDGFEEFVDIIKKLTKIFKHILVISHNESVKQFFGTQIIVSKKDKDSSVDIFRNGERVS